MSHRRVTDRRAPVGGPKYSQESYNVGFQVVAMCVLTLSAFFGGRVQERNQRINFLQVRELGEKRIEAERMALQEKTRRFEAEHTLARIDEHAAAGAAGAGLMSSSGPELTTTFKELPLRITRLFLTPELIGTGDEESGGGEDE